MNGLGNQQATLHRKAIGTIGELAVAKDLINRGYFVFSEIGDLSKIDLIAIKGNETLKIQVKTTYLRDGCCHLYFTKSAKGYKYQYSSKDVDIFALYVADIDSIAYVNSKASDYFKTMTFRNEKPKGRNQRDTNLLRDYFSIERALRDYTPPTVTSRVDGEEIVQTTTQPRMVVASES